jgi:AraC-like DNA-binding protein
MYREEPPEAELRAWVHCAWVHHGVGSALIVPDTCVDLLWDGRTLRVAGPDTRPTRELIDGTIHGIRLRTGCAPAVLGLPASALLDTRVELRELLDVEPWLDRLQRERPDAVLRDFVRSRGREPDPLVLALITRLRAQPTLRLPRLAAELGVSERQLHRRCTHAVGYGPKLLARILRMQNFALAIHAEPLASLAVQMGFSDQAHLGHEAVTLYGRTPGELRARARA